MKKPPGDILAVVGKTLFGPRWQRPLATPLGIHEKQLRLWKERPGGLREGHMIFERAAFLLEKRADECRRVLHTLSQWRV